MDRGMKQLQEEYDREIAVRKKSVANCRVIELERVPRGKLNFLPSGSISVFVGKKGSPNLETLHSSLAGGDYDAFGAALGAHVERLGKILEGKKPFNGGSLHNAAVLGEVSYHGKKLSSMFMVNDALPVNFAFLPYSGGNLNHGAFQLTQYAKGSDHLESLVVLRKPELTKVEQDILKQIPPEQVSLQIGDGGVYANALAAVAAAGAGALLVAGAFVGAYYVFQYVARQLQQQQAKQNQAAAQDQAAQQEQAAQQQAQQDQAQQQAQQDQQQQAQQDQQQAQQDQQQAQQDQQQAQQDQGQGQQDQGGGSQFYKELSELAYEFGAGELTAAASAEQLLALRTQYVQQFFGQ
jgi:hypothetical protein